MQRDDGKTITLDSSEYRIVPTDEGRADERRADPPPVRPRPDPREKDEIPDGTFHGLRPRPCCGTATATFAAGSAGGAPATLLLSQPRPREATMIAHTTPTPEPRSTDPRRPDPRQPDQRQPDPRDKDEIPDGTFHGAEGAARAATTARA